jgi:RNA polymerase sigma-70 factor (ECF subfamily)
MLFNNHIYTRRTEYIKGEWHYFVTVAFNKSDIREVEVSETIYDVLEELRKNDRNIAQQTERHNEYQDLSDEAIYERALVTPAPLDEAVLDHLLVEQILSAVKTLPPVQAKRFVLRNALGLTYPEIGKIEDCTARAVKHSVDLATKQIRRILNL